jgi:hypothetical protein
MDNLYIKDKSRLVLASTLMLFVEMTLIRWVGSNIYQIFFFTNFILIASFLGIGIGFLRAHKTKSYFSFAPILLALIILFCYLYSMDYQVKLNPTTRNLDYYLSAFNSKAYPIILTLPIIFIAVVATLASIADTVARSFKQLPSLTAYRLEVLGTLAGIIIFSALAFFELPPLAWGIIIALLFCVLLFDHWRASGISLLMIMQICAIALILGTFYIESTMTHHIWSTYYKIQVKSFAPDSYVVNVNGLAQQIIEPLQQRKKIKPFYFKPYEHLPKNKVLDHVLVIGSGTGGDVAIALAYGAKQVDAVEIDAALYRLGKKLNVDKPYDDPRVSVYINDGRAFLQRTTQQYDLIIYALTDSLMSVTGLSSVRLENYLYTLEGLTAAANHLKPNGVFAIYNYYGVQWFPDRLANTLNLIYKHPPCIDSYSAQDYWATVLTISRNKNLLQCSSLWKSTYQAYEKPATDNHPFIYLQENTLPPIYIFALLSMAVIAFFIMRQMGTSLTVIARYFDLFLMGTAFLLLETSSVVNYALLFGTTWLVNSLVFIGILSSVYLAIEMVARVKKFNIYILYFLLILSLFIVWMIPISSLLTFEPYTRFFLAACFLFSPIFIANLIFAERFDIISNSTDALGANLIGAVVGGFLEYSALAIGYQHFALIILCIYSIAFCWLLVFHNGRVTR